MTTFLLVSAFVCLAGLFLHGASDSLHDPAMSEWELESRTRDSVYTAGQALVLGIGLLIVGLAVLA